MEEVKKELEEKGYVIIEDILSKYEIEKAKEYFYEWTNNEEVKRNLNIASIHGIIKYLEVGHQKHAWYIRTRPQIVDVFQKLWDTNKLAVSFDGSCWIKAENNQKDKCWTHTDQGPKKEENCYQSFVTLTTNKERTLVIYEGSHKLHADYMKEYNVEKSDWTLIDQNYLQNIKHTKKILHIKEGSLVIWNSKCFHQNQFGKSGEERIVQYVCYLPKNHKKYTTKMEEKRIKYFNERRTTSHWPYPVKVNQKQPRTYGNPNLVIDYSKLDKVDLSEWENEIKKLI